MLQSGVGFGFFPSSCCVFFGRMCDFKGAYEFHVHPNDGRHVVLNEQFNARIRLLKWMQLNSMNDYCHFSYRIQLTLFLSLSHSNRTNSTAIVSVYYLLLHVALIHFTTMQTTQRVCVCTQGIIQKLDSSHLSVVGLNIMDLMNC